MEGKTLPKGEDKKDLSLEKLEEVEKAYSDLMKAYSSCISSLNQKKIKFPPFKSRFSKEWQKEFRKESFLHKDNYAPTYPKKWSTKLLLTGNILAPRLTKWNIRKQVDLLREAFLLLISQNRNKIDSKIIKQFETYCEDLNELSAQFRKSSLIPLFYGSITAVAAISVPIVAHLEGVHVDDVLFGGVLVLPLSLFYLAYFFVFFLLRGFRGSKRVFREASVLEKEEKKFVLIQEYLKFV